MEEQTGLPWVMPEGGLDVFKSVFRHVFRSTPGGGVVEECGACEGDVPVAVPSRPYHTDAPYTVAAKKEKARAEINQSTERGSV